jgi:hypothetical protein
LDQYRKIIELQSKEAITTARFHIARLYITKRMFPEAFTQIGIMQKSERPDINVTSLLVVAYGFQGKREEEGRILNGLKNKRRQDYLRPYILAEDYAALGEKDLALEWLQKAYQERDDWIVWIKVDPNLDGLRAEPRFANLLSRVGLSQ